MQLSHFSRRVLSLLTDNAPAILTSMSIAGTISTTILAVKATPDAHIAILNAQSEQTEPLTVMEKTKLVWKDYIPTAISGTVTVGCILAANKILTKRQATAMALYAITDRAYEEYQSKVRETIGKGKEQKIREAVVKDRMTDSQKRSSEIIITGSGETLCYDVFSGRTFMSSMETIRKAMNDINFQANNEMYASLNDFYRLVNLPPVGVGEEVGWRNDVHMDIQFSSHLTEDGKPCLAIEFKNHPIRGYWKMN